MIVILQSEDVKKDNTPNKYAVKSPKNFSSNFIAKMKACKETEQRAEEEKQNLEELQRIAVCHILLIITVLIFSYH